MHDPLQDFMNRNGARVPVPDRSDMWDEALVANLSNILLSASSIPENSAPGTVIGVLSGSGGASPYGFAILTDPDLKFAVAGSNLVSRAGASFDAEASASHSVTIRMTDALTVVTDRTFAISVINQDAPSIVTAPAITGTLKVGQTLSVSDGTWSGSPSSYARQWQRSDDGATGWANISGATGATYILAAADDLKYLRATVTATNAEGASAPAASAATGQVTYPVAVATGGLPDVSYTQGTGDQTVNAAPDFSGATGGAWSVTGGGATIDTSGVVTISTSALLAGVTITVSYTNSGGVANSAFQATVSSSVTLGALSLDVATVSEIAAVDSLVGNIVGLTSGSTRTLIDDGGGWFRLSGGQSAIIVDAPLDYETATSRNITIRETLAGATNTPRDTVIAITITDVAGPVAANGIADQDYTEGAAISALNVAADFTISGALATTYALAPSSAALPAGLSLSSAGLLTGTPTTPAAAVAIVVRATNSEGTADSAFQITISAAADTTAPEITAASAGAESGGVIPITMSITEAGTVDYVLTDHDPTGISVAQVLAGTDEADAAATDQDQFTVTASGDYDVAVPSGLSGSTFYIAMSIIDASGNRSTDVDIVGPMTIDTTTGATSQFVGSAYISSFSTSHTFDNGTPTDTAALPATYAAGTYLLGIQSGSVVPTAVTVDGTSATLVQSYVDGTTTVSAWEVTLAGGGSGQIVVTLAVSKACAVTLYELDPALGLVASLAYSRQIGGGSPLPANEVTAGGTHLTTLAGDTVFVFASSAQIPTGWNGLVEVDPASSVNSRYLFSAWASSAAGGDPETMNLQYALNWIGTTFVTLQYR